MPLLGREDGRPTPDRDAWADTAIDVPERLAGCPVHDVLTGARIAARTAAGNGTRLALADVLEHFPVALLAAGPG